MQSQSGRTGRPLRPLTTSAVLALTFACAARADTFNWIGTAGSNAWSDPANWTNWTVPPQSPTAYPADGDTAILDTSGYNFVNLLAPSLSLDTLQLPGPSSSIWLVGSPPPGPSAYTLSSNNGTGSTILHLNQITAGPNSGFGLGGGGSPNIIDNTVTLQGPAASTLNITTSRSLSLQGPVIAPGGISVAGGYFSGAIELHSASNSITSLNITGSVVAYGPGSIRQATINIGTPFLTLGGNSLTLVSDAPVADYGNDINVTGTANLAVGPTVANNRDPANTVFQLGNVTFDSANSFFGGALHVDNTFSHDLLQFQNLDINGPAALYGTNPSLYTPRSVVRFSSLTGHPTPPPVILPGDGGVILFPTPHATSLTLIGGEFDFAGAGAFPGPISVWALLVAQTDGALGNGPVNVAPGGALRFDAPQSNLPPIFVDAGGAIGGDLTGANYCQNLTLAPGAILFPTAGPLPARPADSGPVYWRGVDSLSATFTVGDDGSPSSIYRGAAFGPFTPDGPFVGTLNEPAPDTGLQILATAYTAIGDPVSGTPATFNSTKDVTITLTGNGEVDFFQPLAGTARVFNLFAPPESSANNPGSGTFAFLGSGIIPPGDTVNLKTGELYITDHGDAVADGAKVNVFPGARLSESGNGTLSTGTFEIMPGGILSLRFADATGGAHFIFDPGSIVELTFGIGDASWIPPQSDILISNVVYGVGTGLQLAPGQRLGSATGGELDNTPVTARPDAPADAVFKLTSAAGNAQYGGLVLYNCPVTLGPGQTLQIGDTVPSPFDGQLPTGSVQFIANSVNVGHLNVVSGTLLLGAAGYTLPQINASTVAVQHGATLAGSGVINANQFTLAGTLSPGFSPGTLQVNADTTLLPGASYTWQIDSTSPLAGPGVAWDLLLVNGLLTIDPAAAADPILISLQSLNEYDANDLLPGFDPTQSYAFPFIQATTLAGFDPADFALDLSDFRNPYDGTWTIQQSAPGELDLVYTPAAVPEPRTLAWLAAAIVPWVRRRRATV